MDTFQIWNVQVVLTMKKTRMVKKTQEMLQKMEDEVV